jgi:hypothetical protein
MALYIEVVSINRLSFKVNCQYLFSDLKESCFLNSKKTFSAVQAKKMWLIFIHGDPAKNN